MLDSFIEKIEKMEVAINFLIEGISIVNRAKELSCFDIILIMNRFDVGLLRIDCMIQAIKYACARICIYPKRRSI